MPRVEHDVKGNRYVVIYEDEGLSVGPAKADNNLQGGVTFTINNPLLRGPRRALGLRLNCKHSSPRSSVTADALTTNAGADTSRPMSAQVHVSDGGDTMSPSA